MKEIRIIGNEIYYDNVLVAKLVNSFNATDMYKEKYNQLCDALIGYGDLDEAERLVGSLKRTKDNKDTLEDVENCLSSIRNALDYMYEAAE